MNAHHWEGRGETTKIPSVSAGCGNLLKGREGLSLKDVLLTKRRGDRAQ